MGLVGLTGFHNHLSNRMCARLQETLGKARRTGLGLGVGEPQLVKGGGNTLWSPNVN